MKVSDRILSVLVLLFSPLLIHAQARPATCIVSPLWVGHEVRSANLGSIGTFQTDGREGSTIRSYKHDGTRLVVTAGIDYEFDYSSTPQKPYRIKLAIAVTPQEVNEVFESIDSSEASTAYGKKWNLSVTKKIKLENLTYLFTLKCWDGATQKN